MSRIKNYTLVIIDMQPYFAAACNNKVLIRNINSEIKRARSLNNHIMFVRYIGCGSITRSLKYATDGYPNVSVVEKDDMDGGDLVLARLKDIGRTHLRMCGVNTEQCVFETVLSVADFYPRRFKIEVISKCCATSTGSKRHNRALKIMAGRENITVDMAA